MEDQLLKALLVEMQYLRNEVRELKEILKESTPVPTIPTKENTNSLERKITDVIDDLEIQPHLKGYSMLREAIKLTVENPTIIRAFFNELYPILAEKFATTPANIERPIRHAIELSYDRNRMHPFYQKYFKNQKPTVTKFIAVISDRLRMEEITLKAVGE